MGELGRAEASADNGIHLFVSKVGYVWDGSLELASFSMVLLLLFRQASLIECYLGHHHFIVNRLAVIDPSSVTLRRN